MKRLLVLQILASCCFAGSLTITGPGPISLKDDTGEVKVMHRFFEAFTSALKTGLANSEKSSLEGDWKMEMVLFHGSATNPLFAEYMDITLAGGRYPSVEINMPYYSVSVASPAQLARSVGKTLWKYMTTGKVEEVPGIRAPQPIATPWLPARRFFY
jgi:hypothetical protein